MTEPHAPRKPESTPVDRASLRRNGIITLVVLALVAAWGIGSRLHAAHSLKENTVDQAVAVVDTIKAPHGPAAEEIVLPGNVQAWHEAPIYARTSGYLKSWSTDIGAHVKAGDLLAEIETPEIDSQMRQAEADLATAEANYNLAQTTAKRWEGLLKTDSVSKQDNDEKLGDAAAKLALVNSARANLDRLKDLIDFKRVVAPFDGVITARNTDNGALINAGSGNALPELFHIAQTDKLRVYVQVPESYAGAITPDLSVDLRLPEHPGRVFPAKLAQTAQALDPVARTLLAEFEVDNHDGELLPGAYAEVHLKLPRHGDNVRLPVNTLLFRSEGLQIATIDENGHALLKPITLGRDFGNEVEVTSGVTAGETVIVNPPDSLSTGQPVRIAVRAPDDKKDGKTDDKKDGEKPVANSDKKSGDKQDGDKDEDRKKPGESAAPAEGNTQKP